MSRLRIQRVLNQSWLRRLSLPNIPLQFLQAQYLSPSQCIIVFGCDLTRGPYLVELPTSPSRPSPGIFETAHALSSFIRRHSNLDIPSSDEPKHSSVCQYKHDSESGILRCRSFCRSYDERLDACLKKPVKPTPVAVFRQHR